MTLRVEDFSRFIRRWWPAGVWMVLMVFASSDAGSAGTSFRLLRPLLRWLDPNISEPQIYDINIALRKTMHVVEFAVLAILVWRAHRKSPLRTGIVGTAALSLGVAAFFAGATEAIQYFFASRRSAQLSDVLLNVGGAAMGLVLLGIFTALRRRYLNKKTK